MSKQSILGTASSQVLPLLTQTLIGFHRPLGAVPFVLHTADPHPTGRIGARHRPTSPFALPIPSSPAKNIPHR